MCLKWKAGGGVIGVIVVVYLLIFRTVFYLFFLIFKRKCIEQDLHLNFVV